MNDCTQVSVEIDMIDTIVQFGGRPVYYLSEGFKAHRSARITILGAKMIFFQQYVLWRPPF